jgi:DNA polymerase III subunit alpha
MKKIKFCSLHHHSTFSFGDGFGTPAQHVARAAELGYSAMSLTEHGNVSSHFQFEKAAVKAGVKPIFGLEAYCGHTDDERRSAWKNHLTILAKDAEGYRNLNRVVTQSFNDFYYHPTVSGSVLGEHSQGLVALSGCSGSLLACSLLGGKGIPEPDRPAMGAAEDVIWGFHDVFGDDFFLEVQPFYELPRSKDINTAYEQLSYITGVPLVVTHDVHYPRMEDAEMQAVLHAVHRGKHSVDDVMREWNYDVPLTLPQSDDDLFKRLVKTGLSKDAAWQAIEMSGYIAEQCNVTLPKAEPLRYPIEDKDMKPWT